MYSALSAFKRMVHPIVTTVRNGVNWGTSFFRSVSAENVTSRYLKGHVKNGRAGKIGFRGRCNPQTIRKHAPGNSLPDCVREVCSFNKIKVTSPGLNAVTRDIECSSVLDRTRPLLGITENAKARYAALTGKKDYLYLNFKCDDVFVRSGSLRPEKQFLSPEFRADNNNMTRSDRRKKTQEINGLTKQADDYLAKALKCPEDPIYKRAYVKKVQKTAEIPEGHPLLEPGQFGLYAAKYMERGTLLCHVGGNLDFCEIDFPESKLRHEYSLQLDVCAPISNRNQPVNGSSRYKIHVTALDEQDNWVGNVGGRVNDPQGTNGEANVAIQWIPVYVKHSAGLPVDMPFLITTKTVFSGQQFYLGYGLDLSTGITEQEVSLTTPEMFVSRRLQMR